MGFFTFPFFRGRYSNSPMSVVPSRRTTVCGS
nr:MAG TPA: hypothetical protein [Caudoviricetes sp.]